MMHNPESLNMLEIELPKPDEFLVIKETLQRIGVCSHNKKKLYQSCHIFHKQGHYYIAHFKEMFLLDGKQSEMAEEDVCRRNFIAKLVCSWGLCSPVNFDPEKMEEGNAKRTTKIIKFGEKNQWVLESKHSIGKEEE